MDPMSKLTVRFHILGEFINYANKVHYVGGLEALSYIDRDLVSLPEIVGHLKDHCNIQEGSLLHWLFPGKELSNGLRVLTDDKACLYMSDCITDGGVADIFVEHGVQGTDEVFEDADYDQDMQIWKEHSNSDSDDAVEVIGCKKVTTISSSPTEYEKDVAKVRQFYGCRSVQSSPGGKATCSKKLMLTGKRKAADSASTVCCWMDELLCAVGRDANGQMYPVAWAVVEKETNDSWDWFCDLFCRDVQVGDGEGWVFISDQQKGILNAVQKWAPMAEHRNCARHVYANWRKKFKKKDFQKKWWRCAKASNRSLFNLAKARLAQDTREGARALANSGPEHYCRAWFRLGSNCDSVDNNICESFNKWIIDARFFPIISLLEAIRCKVMVRIQQQRDAAERWSGNICPNILKKLQYYIKLSGYCHAVSNGQDKYEVRHFDHTFVVSLVERTCSCRYWQLSGMPCPHAIACILFKTNCLDDYVASCYSIEHFKKTYAHCLEPVEGMQDWPVSDRPKPRPPGYVKMPGRPKKARRREAGEKPRTTTVSKVGTRIRCRKCKGLGHNITSCDRRHGVTSEPPTHNASHGSTAPNATPSAPAPNRSYSAAPNAMVVVHGSEQSETSARKNVASGSISVSNKREKNASKKKNMYVSTSASARVNTLAGGSATLNLEAHVPTSQARSKVTVHVTSGHASAQVSAQEPPKSRKKLTPKRARALPQLLLSPEE